MMIDVIGGCLEIEDGLPSLAVVTQNRTGLVVVGGGLWHWGAGLLLIT